MALGPDKDYALNAALVYTATVVYVDASTYTMRVVSKQRGMSKPIEIPSLFTNARSKSGSGVHFLPEIGSEVWICETSDGDKVPLMYHNVIGESYRNKRPYGVAGDIVLSTSEQTAVKVLTGGTVALEATPVCKLLLDPVDDALVAFSSQYKQYSLSYKMEQLRIDEDRSAETIQSYFIKADNASPTVVTKVGNYGNHVYEFSINSTNFLLKSSGEGRVAMQSDTIDIDSPMVTIGTANPVELMKVDPFLVDLQAVLVELGKVVGVLDALLAAVPIPPETPTPNLIPITDMLASIQSGIYATNKLKSE